MSRHPSFESRILEYFETVNAYTGAVVLSIIHEVAKKRGFAPKRSAKVVAAEGQMTATQLITSRCSIKE